MKQFLSNIWVWAVKHKFHFFILSCVIVMAFIIVRQQVMFVQLEINHKADKQEIINIINSTSTDIKNQVGSTTEELDNKITTVSNTTNSRIDILDNTVSVEDKRRELVSKIRQAIQDSTKKNIGIRDLNRIANAVIDYSYQYNLSIAQVLAQISQESNFETEAVSPAGAMGLMQIMPNTLKYIQYEMSDAPPKLNAFNIYHNIKAGCFYMSEQLEEFGSYEYALKAYNWGPDRVHKYKAGEIKVMPDETQKYIPSIMEKIKFFQEYGLE